MLVRVANDLKAAFPEMKGFSPRNVKYMRYFAEHCPDGRFGQQAAAQLPWFHIVTLLTKAEPEEREWYAVQAIAQYAVNGMEKPIGIAEFHTKLRSYCCERILERGRPARFVAFPRSEATVTIATWYQTLRDLPLPLAGNLPSIEEIEAELANEILPDAQDDGDEA